MANMGIVTKSLIASSDDLIRAFYTKLDDVLEAAVKKTVVVAPTIPGKVIGVGEKISTFASKKAVPFVAAHPVLVASLASAAAGGLIVTALQRQGSITTPANPYDYNTPYDPNNVAINQGVVTEASKIVTPEDKKDFGVVGNALGWASTTMFGQTGEEVGNFVEGAKPWVVAGGVIVGVIALGYAVNSVRGRH